MLRVHCSVQLVVLFAINSLAQIPDSDLTKNILKGAIDFHIHSSPDVVERSVDDLGAAESSAKRGLKAIVLKNHVSSTAARAQTTNSSSTGTIVFGGVVLNHAVGGINSYAVDAMVKMSPDYGKVVWFPTMDAVHHMATFGIKGDGLSVFLNNELSDETIRVLQIIAAKKLVLATGHLSPEEIFELVKEARKRGIANILITHPMTDVPGLTLLQMEELAKEGALIELTFLSYLAGPNAQLPGLRSTKHVSMEEMSQAIKRIGADSFILSSDLGQAGNTIPSEGLQIFAEMLVKNGIPISDIEKMVKLNPARLLGLAP